MHGTLPAVPGLVSDRLSGEESALLSFSTIETEGTSPLSVLQGSGSCHLQESRRDHRSSFSIICVLHITNEISLVSCIVWPVCVKIARCSKANEKDGCLWKTGLVEVGVMLCWFGLPLCQEFDSLEKDRI